MKITIELTNQEVQGIKAYLESTETPTHNAAITSEVRMRLKNALHDPREAISDYIDDKESNVDYKKYNY